MYDNNYNPIPIHPAATDTTTDTLRSSTTKADVSSTEYGSSTSSGGEFLALLRKSPLIVLFRTRIGMMIPKPYIFVVVLEIALVI